MTNTDMSAWVGELSAALVAGHSATEAMDRAVRLGGEPGDVLALASALERRAEVSSARRTIVQLRCYRWLQSAYAALAAIRQDPHTIDEVNWIEQPEFLLDYYSYNRALCLRGIAGDWPAVKNWNKQYLKSICGSEEVEVMTGRAAAPIPKQNTSNDLKRTMRFDDYLDLVFSEARSNDYYLVARNRFFDSEGTRPLLADFGHLPFVNTQSDTADIKLWLGPGGTYTPLHYDARNNLLVQIIGTKVFRLYPPYYSEFMDQTVPWYAGVDPGLASEVAEAGTDSKEPPAILVQLAPGDALFLPVGWWHAVSAQSTSLSINFHDFGVANDYPFL